MKTLTIKETHKHLLGIAKEFDRICTQYKITYYMIGGTLLGAVRHKGFIPWDDDMDFGVPINEYEKLLHILKAELKEPYRVCTYKEMKGCNTVFAKIDDYTTVIEDKCQAIPLKEQIGLNIDIFPLCLCNKNDKRNKSLQSLRLINRLIFTESTEGQKYKHIVKKILRLLYPHSREYLLDKIWETAQSINEGEFLANLFGLAGERELIPLEYYGDDTRYAFEDTMLRGPKKYDDYLRQIYHDYLELPPLEKRKKHSSNTYYRDSIS